MKHIKLFESFSNNSLSKILNDIIEIVDAELQGSNDVIDYISDDELDEVISKLDDKRIKKILLIVKGIIKDEDEDNVSDSLSELLSDDDYNYIKDYIYFLDNGKMPVKRDTSNDKYPKALIELSSVNKGNRPYWSFYFMNRDESNPMVHALSDEFLNKKLSGVDSPNDVLSREISLINGLNDKKGNNLVPESYKKLNINIDAKLNQLQRNLDRSRRWAVDDKVDFYNYLSNNGFIIRSESYIFKVVDSDELETEIQNLIDYSSKY